MRSTLVNRILTVIGVAGSCTAFASIGSDVPKTFHYWVRIPATSSSCAEEAARLAARVQFAVGATSSVGTCKGTVDAHFDGGIEHLYSIEVSYQAAEQAAVYSAKIGGMTDIISNNTERGSYGSYAECRADMAAQNAAFSRETGLTAVASFCEPDTLEENHFNLQIDGFGKPKRSLFAFQLNYGWDNATKSDAVRKLLQTQGAHIVRAVGSVTLYYAESPVSVRQDNFGLFEKLPECEAQKETAANLYLATGSKSPDLLVITCDQDMQAGGAYSLYGVADGYSFLETSEVPRKYYSFDECMQDREHAIQESGFTGNAAAICSPSFYTTGEYQMEIFR